SPSLRATFRPRARRGSIRSRRSAASRPPPPVRSGASEHAPDRVSSFRRFFPSLRTTFPEPSAHSRHPYLTCQLLICNDPPVNETSALQREIRQTRPFRSRSQEAMLALLRTADQVHRSFARVVEPHGITLQQYNVLRILRGAGDAGLPTLEIGARMIERSPGVTRLIDRLEAKGWVRRERCPHDRRQVLCWITP